jgi:2'-5' RNA ligase
VQNQDMPGRFAIYAVPGIRPADAGAALLREKAEQWLGRSVTGDSVAGDIAAPGVTGGWTREAIHEITTDARRYGFHATLKPPFRLAEGRTPGELDAAVARFAASRGAVAVPRLALARLGDGFFALVPGAEAPDLYALADAVVTGFDDFRAPVTRAEIARRDPASRTPRQRELLEAWGYPYVLDEFQFHLTLTDRVPEGQRPEAERALRDWFAVSIGVTVSVDALCLFTEAEPGAPFTLHAVHPLRPVPDRASVAEQRKPARLTDLRTSAEGPAGDHGGPPGHHDPPGVGHRPPGQGAPGGQVFGVDAHSEQGSGHRLGGIQQVIQGAGHMLPGDRGQRGVLVQ